MEITEQINELVEILGIHFEKHRNLPPLASRILAYLIMDNREEGITFEELVTELQASKSSISTNVNLLLKIDHIYYRTQKGDRKKYYKVSPLSCRLKYMLDNIEEEIAIAEKLKNFRTENTETETDKKKLLNSITYKEHLLQMKDLMQITLQKLILIENNSN